MADLPDLSVPPPPVSTPPAPVGAGMNKEAEPAPRAGLRPEAPLPIVDLGRELDLPKEVTAAGVSQHPTVVSLPHPVAAQGVQPAGQNVTSGSGATVTLPLTDEKIEEGLHAGIGSSVRWLAVWCVRQLKRMHIGLRKVGAAWVRVRE
jgi:hypothetical protein